MRNGEIRKTAAGLVGLGWELPARRSHAPGVRIAALITMLRGGELVPSRRHEVKRRFALASRVRRERQDLEDRCGLGA